MKIDRILLALPLMAALKLFTWVVVGAGFPFLACIWGIGKLTEFLDGLAGYLFDFRFWLDDLFRDLTAWARAPKETP